MNFLLIKANTTMIKQTVIASRIPFLKVKCSGKLSDGLTR